MIKKQVYPKTKRVKVKNEKICQLTEKWTTSRTF